MSIAWSPPKFGTHRGMRGSFPPTGTRPAFSVSREKSVRTFAGNRPFGCFAQMTPDTFFSSGPYKDKQTIVLQSDSTTSGGVMTTRSSWSRGFRSRTGTASSCSIPIGANLEVTVMDDRRHVRAVSLNRPASTPDSSLAAVVPLALSDTPTRMIGDSRNLLRGDKLCSDRQITCCRPDTPSS